jgi:hypothetical protein
VLLCAEAGNAAVAIERMALHQFEDGPVLAPSHVFIPGETVFFSCRLSGYQMATTGDEQRSVKLAWQIQVSDPAGVAVELPAAAALKNLFFRRIRTGCRSFCTASWFRLMLWAALTGSRCT